MLLVGGLTVWSVGVGTQDSAAPAFVLAGLATRSQQYYERFISIICTETVQTQNLKANLSPDGPPRTTVYELSVSREVRGKDGDGEFRVERALQSVNGRPARKGQRAECTDPKTGTPEPLEFLLPANQKRYRFTISSAVGPPGTSAIDFVETPPEPVRVTWEGSCFEAGGGGQNGRLWFDPETYDVFRVDLRLAKPFLITLPQGAFGVRPPIRVERSEMTLRFSRVTFQQPDEELMLPVSIETLNVMRGVPSVRITQSLKDYRRFLTKSEIRGD
jgi:hypothetical protein